VTYTITDNQGGTSQATLTLSVSGAGGDSFTVDEGSPDNVFDVLQNDTGTGLTITSFGSTSNGGIVTIIDSGTRLNYSRPANDDFFGTETFTYTATASNGQVSTATVIVTVSNTNDAPTAVDDIFTVTKGSTGNTLNPLTNDSNAPDPIGEVLTIISVDDTNTIGFVSLVNGSIQYSAPTTFPSTGLATGTDTFSYTIDDGTGLTSAATATVNVVDFVPGSLSGFVFVDGDNDGVRDAGEEAFEGVTISLSGTSDFGDTVTLQTITAADGSYTFTGLTPGTYTITETQPTGVRNGVPIVDGQDTIGSQGGVVSANDQFSITLAEGTDGVDNNFAELLGRTLSGSILHSVSGSDDFEAFGGLNLLLFNDNGTMTSGTEIASVNSAGGAFAYSAIAPGDYRVLAPTPTFLLSNESSSFALSVTAEADSTDNQITIRGREASFISLRDISTMSPTEYAHVAVGTSGQEWYSFGRGWEGFTDASFTLTNGGADLRIEVTDASGQTLATDLAKSDSRLRIIGQKSGLDLVQIMAGSAAFDLQAVTPANGNGAVGEGSTVVAHATMVPAIATASAIAPAAAAVTSTPSDASPEGESSTTVTGGVQVYQPVISRPIQAPTPVETVTTTTSNDASQVPVIPPQLLVPNTGNTVSVTSAVDLRSNDDSATTDDVTEETRAALLVEVADAYGDQFRYGASSGAEFVPLEEDLDEATEDIEVVPADLLDELAASVANA
jgi:hypothetical protein